MPCRYQREQSFQILRPERLCSSSDGTRHGHGRVSTRDPWIFFYRVRDVEILGLDLLGTGQSSLQVLVLM